MSRFNGSVRPASLPSVRCVLKNAMMRRRASRVLVVPRPGNASQEPKQQGGIRRVVVVHEAMTDTGVDLHVVRHLELGQQPAELLPGTSTEG
jgi:hypothetical protein